MKKIVLIVVACIFATFTFAQDLSLAKAALKNFADGETYFHKAKYNEALDCYQVVVDNIDESTVPKPSYIVTKIKAEARMVEIYTDKVRYQSKACEHVYELQQLLGYVKLDPKLKKKDAVAILDAESRVAKAIKDCESFGKVDSDKSSFELNSFKEEFPESTNELPTE